MITPTQGWPLSKPLPTHSKHRLWLLFTCCLPPLTPVHTNDPFTESKYRPVSSGLREESPGQGWWATNALRIICRASTLPSAPRFRNFLTFANWMGSFSLNLPTTPPVERCTCVIHSALASPSLGLSLPTLDLQQIISQATFTVLK